MDSLHWPSPVINWIGWASEKICRRFPWGSKRFKLPPSKLLLEKE